MSGIDLQIAVAVGEHNRTLSTRRAGRPVAAVTLPSLKLIQGAGDMDKKHLDIGGELD